jgi:hypothetical protein
LGCPYFVGSGQSATDGHGPPKRQANKYGVKDKTATLQAAGDGKNGRMASRRPRTDTQRCSEEKQGKATPRGAQKRKKKKVKRPNLTYFHYE